MRKWHNFPFMHEITFFIKSTLKCLKYLIDYFDEVAPDLLLWSYSFQRLRTDGCNPLNQISVFGSECDELICGQSSTPQTPCLFVSSSQVGLHHRSLLL